MNRRRSLLAAASAWALVGPARAEWDSGSAVVLPSLMQFDGTPLDVAALRGKVVIIEFWASWCPFCARQNPHIEALYRAHRARGLEVIGVSIDKDPKAAVDYLRKHGYTFKAGLATPEWMRIYRLRRGLPQLYVIGRDGRVARIEQGEMLDDEIRDLANLI